LSCLAIALSLAWPCRDRLVPRGRYWRSSLLAFSFDTRCQGQRGSEPQNNGCEVAASCSHSIFAKRLECCADQLSPPPNRHCGPPCRAPDARDSMTTLRASQAARGCPAVGVGISAAFPRRASMRCLSRCLRSPQKNAQANRGPMVQLSKVHHATIKITVRIVTSPQ
jgi:hypothetical protein